MLGLGQSAANDVTSAEDVEWSSARGNYQDARTFSRAGAPLVAIGVAALAGGVVWAIVARPAETEVSIGPGGVRVRGTF